MYFRTIDILSVVESCLFRDELEAILYLVGYVVGVDLLWARSLFEIKSELKICQKELIKQVDFLSERQYQEFYSQLVLRHYQDKEQLAIELSRKTLGEMFGYKSYDFVRKIGEEFLHECVEINPAQDSFYLKYLRTRAIKKGRLRCNYH